MPSNENPMPVPAQPKVTTMELTDAEWNLLADICEDWLKRHAFGQRNGYDSARAMLAERLVVSAGDA